jgi:hypothetical protein
MTTPEPLSDEQLAEIRAEAVADIHAFCDPLEADLKAVPENTLRLLDEHARLKATVERVGNVPLCTQAGCRVAVATVLEAISPDASTTETKR